MIDSQNVSNDHRRYIEEILAQHRALTPILPSSAVILSDNGPVWDFLILLPENLFEKRIVKEYGPSLVIDDHEHSPWVFTKVRSFEWLRQDIARRTAIALWIYSRAKVLQDPEQRFSELIRAFQQEYANNIPALLRQKYLELRSERHNLRHTAFHGQGVASELIKSFLVKLALELCFVFEGKPYPFKAHLPSSAVKETGNGKSVLFHSEKLLETKDPHEVIQATDELIREIDRFLITSPHIAKSLLDSWWLCLP